jgi:SAM-dependent methyltransferase
MALPAPAGRVLRVLRSRLRFPLYLGTRFHCPMCHLRFRRMLPLGVKAPLLVEKKVIGGGWRPNARCPFCGSSDRERLVYLYLDRESDLLRRRTRVLQIAPEKALERKLRKNPLLEVTTGDLMAAHVDRTFDVTAIPFPDAVLDLVICNHVLEHVTDDRKAMREFLRILRPGGTAILQVPIATAADRTDEDPTVTDPRLREARFGQEDHVRLYSDADYRARIEEAGFDLTVLDIAGRPAYAKFALVPGELLYVARRPAA